MHFYSSILNHPWPPKYLFFSLHGNLKVRPLFLQRDSRPRLQAASRNESIVKSNSTTPVTGVLIGHHLGNHSCKLRLAAAAGCAESEHSRFKNVKGAFPCTELRCVPSLQGHRHMSLPVYTSASIQSLLPNELYKFNHVEGCLVCHQVLIRVREGWGLISSPSATSLIHEGMKL